MARVLATPRAHHVALWLPIDAEPRAIAAWNVSAQLLWSRFDLLAWEAHGTQRDTTGCVDNPLEQPDLLQLSLGSHHRLLDVLDQEHMRELSPYDGDGGHCLQGAVCRGDLDLLVRLLERGPRTP